MWATSVPLELVFPLHGSSVCREHLAPLGGVCTSTAVEGITGIKWVEAGLLFHIYSGQDGSITKDWPAQGGSQGHSTRMPALDPLIISGTLSWTKATAHLPLETSSTFFRASPVVSGLLLLPRGPFLGDCLPFCPAIPLLPAWSSGPSLSVASVLPCLPAIHSS